MQNQKIIFFSILIFSLISAFHLYAQENQNQIEEIQQAENQESENSQNFNNSEDDKIKSQVSKSLTVTKINFSGLKKTKDFYIQSKVKKFLNTSVEDFDLHGLETTLQLENLFDNIEISMKEISSGEASVEISVKEKITFIPLPFAMFSDSGFMGGLMVMDTNAFGVKDMFVFGGLYSKSQILGMAIFSKPPKANGIPGFTVSVSSAKNTNTLVNLEKDDVLEYDALSFSSSLAITERVGEFNQISLGGFFKSISTDQVDDYPKIDSLNSAGISASYGISKSDWNGWFISNVGAGVSAGMSLYSSKSDYKYAKTLSANFQFQHPIIDRMRFYSAASAFYGKDQHISSYSGGGAGAVTILPGDFRTQEIAGANAGIELALVKGKIGTLSVYGDYQVVSAQDFDDEFCFMHGPNGGIRVYLAKIAFPALALGLSYNITKHYTQFAAAFGISM